MARYMLRAQGASGPVEFRERLTIDEALVKVQMLRKARFNHVTLINVMTGVEIKDVETLIVAPQRSNPK